MVKVEEAKRLLFEEIQRSKSVKVKIADALGCVISQDIFSPIDMPLFDQSSMDGYAVCSGNDFSRKEFTVVGEIKAGDDISVGLSPGECVRIYTGAAVPESSDAIIIQENTEEKNGKISVRLEYKKSDHIRLKSSQIKKGELALKKNMLLNPAAIGFLAMLGIETVEVFLNPKISIIVTGNEIVRVGEELKRGKIYESNSVVLNAALKQMNINVNHQFTVEDDKNELKKKIELAIADSDILILSGGISVGKYDFVFDALKELGTKETYYKIYQKPGKPMFAGKLKGTFVFALPGNPASALVCFYEYVYPSIRKMCGFVNYELRKLMLKTVSGIKKKEGKAAFIRSKITDEGVMELEGQGSDMLRSFSEADSFIYLDLDKGNITQNELVEVHLLPVYF